MGTLCCPNVRGTMTGVTPFWMRKALEKQHVKKHRKQKASQKSNKFLAKITEYSYKMWVVGPKARTNGLDLP
jgi:hypothetical protein